MAKRRATAADDARDLVRALGIDRAEQVARSLARGDKHLHVRCSSTRLDRYRAAATRAGTTLSAWVLLVLDRSIP